MPIISKQLFDKVVSSDITCISIIHPSTESCVKGLYDMALSTTIGSSKFFLLIYVLQTITKWKKINKNFIKKQIKAYIRSMCYALCYLFGFCNSVCLLRKCMTKFNFYSIALSGTCAGLSIFVESKENKALNTSIFLNMVVETIFRRLYWKKSLIRNVFREALIFMCCSAILQYLLRTKKNKSRILNFWKVFSKISLYLYNTKVKINCFRFYYPPIAKELNGICNHKYSCSEYIFKGFFNYFIMGYILNLLKYWAPRINIAFKHPKSLLIESLKKDKVLFGMLFGGYVGVFRIIQCILRKSYKKEEALHFAVAGFLAGSAYLFRPTISILAICITTALQLLIQRIDYKNIFQSKLPTTEIVFALCSGFLFHNRFLLSDSCPQYVKMAMNSITNGKVDELYQQALRLFEDHLTEAAVI
ncbi:hypothetical protein ILUMI_14293 [Ignelater luminosus]|uniref:Transmembrane protein 135 N-terminal domain-containing protein n=1 Tax=Ignelater luminosus TaxID=2038154 RepID=A0A8K0CV13_IGNLU|nr:hypothetical protein ILUMI_14293 [Ignelater luminosus]